MELENGMTIWTDIRRVMTQNLQFWRGKTSLESLELRQVLLGVALIALARVVADMIFWFKPPYQPDIVRFTTHYLLWSLYVTSLCFATAFLFSRLVPRATFKKVLTMVVALYWVIPFVSAFSLLPLERSLRLGQFGTVPFFEWIPTFNVTRNYLPLGMVIVSPLVFFMTVRFLVREARVSTMRALLTSLLAFLLIYVYYYNFAWQPYVIAYFDKGLIEIEAYLAANISYYFMSQVITFLLTPFIVRAYDLHPQWVYVAASGALLALMLLVPRVGVVSVFVVQGNP